MFYIADTDTVGYKKCIILVEGEDGTFLPKECIVELEVPKGAKIVKVWPNNKMRCDKAIVKAMFLPSKDALDKETVAYSISDFFYYVWDLDTDTDKMDEYKKIVDEIKKRCFKYIVGETVIPDNFFDENPHIACSSGIHYFDSFSKALNYSGVDSHITIINNFFIKYNSVIDMPNGGKE